MQGYEVRSLWQEFLGLIKDKPDRRTRIENVLTALGAVAARTIADASRDKKREGERVTKSWVKAQLLIMENRIVARMEAVLKAGNGKPAGQEDGAAGGSDDSSGLSSPPSDSDDD
jgi:hypothetical protein